MDAIFLSYTQDDKELFYSSRKKDYVPHFVIDRTIEIAVMNGFQMCVVAVFVFVP